MNTDADDGRTGMSPADRVAERCETGRRLVVDGRPLDAAAVFDEAAALAGAAGALSLQGEALANAGVALHLAGRLDEALHRSRAASSLFGHLGDEASRRLVEENCAVIHRDLGEWERAARAAETAERLGGPHPGPGEPDGLLSLQRDRAPGGPTGDPPPAVTEPVPGDPRPAVAAPALAPPTVAAPTVALPPAPVPAPAVALPTAPEPAHPVPVAAVPVAAVPVAAVLAPAPTPPAFRPTPVTTQAPPAPPAPAPAVPGRVPPPPKLPSPQLPPAQVAGAPAPLGAPVPVPTVAAVPVAEPAPDLLGRRLETMAASRLQESGPSAALGDCFAAFRHYLATGEDAGRYRSTLLLVVAYQQLGRWPDALRALTDALDLARGLRAVGDLPLLHASLAATNVALGRLVPATAAAATAVEGYRANGNAAGLGRSLVTLGQCLASLGDHEAALRHWTEAHTLLSGVDPEAATAAAGLLAAAQLT